MLPTAFTTRPTRRRSSSSNLTRPSGCCSRWRPRPSGSPMTTAAAWKGRPATCRSTPSARDGAPSPWGIATTARSGSSITSARRGNPPRSRSPLRKWPATQSVRMSSRTRSRRARSLTTAWTGEGSMPSSRCFTPSQPNARRLSRLASATRPPMTRPRSSMRRAAVARPVRTCSFRMHVGHA